MAGISQIQQKLFSRRMDKAFDTNLSGSSFGSTLDALKLAITEKLSLNNSGVKEGGRVLPDALIPADGPYPLKYVAKLTGVGEQQLRTFIKNDILIAYAFSSNSSTMVTKENLNTFIDYLQENHRDDGTTKIKKKDNDEEGD